MVEVQRDGFLEFYEQQLPNVVKMRITAEDDTYTLRCDVDLQGDDDMLLFEKAEFPTNTARKDELTYEEITDLIAVLEFAETFAEENGYEFRGPRVGIE